MRSRSREIGALAIVLTGVSCANSDLTSEYGKPHAAGSSGAGTGGQGTSGAGAAGKAGASLGGSAGAAGKAGGGGTGGAGGAAGTAGSGGLAGSGGKAGASGGAGKGGTGAGGQSGSSGAAGKSGSAGAAGGKGGSGGAAGSSGGAGKAGAAGSSGGAGKAGAAGTGGQGGVTGTPVCGNGVVDNGEQCDEASGLPKNGCFPTCTKSVSFHAGSYAPASGNIISPERGYHDDIDLTSTSDYLYVRQHGFSLTDAFVLLTPYVGGPIDAAFLTSLQDGFARVRAAGIKVILRFAYEKAGGVDAPKAIILQHIQQLAPLIAANADVIAVMQAGFIGEYGGWYNSSNGLTNPADEKAILDALLAALPPSRSILLRTPMEKNALYPGGPLVASNAHDGSDKSRVGHTDDCFVSSPDDYGTYDVPIQMWEDYVAADSVYVPVAGAPCGLSPPRSDCPTTQAELAAHHFSILSGYYDGQVVDGWKAQGCYDVIGAALGYHLFVASGSYLDNVPPGGALGVKVVITNAGYAAPFNARPFKVVLTNGATRLVADVPGVDVRTWLGGQDVSLELWFRVPTFLPKGVYDLALYLPAPEASIAAVPEYALRFANASGFNTFTGENVIGSVTVDPGAPGAIDPKASTFSYLPP